MKLRILTLILLFIGLVIFAYSLTLPYYKDQFAADKLLSNSHNIDKDAYYLRNKELRTDKTLLMDIGSGLGILSAALLLFLITSKIQTYSDFKTFKTFNKPSIFISANLAWLLMWPETHWYYIFRGGRGDFPPFADSIGIPIMAQTTMIFMAIIPMNIFVFLTTMKSNLPSTLFIRPDSYKSKALMWEIFFGFWLLVNQLFLVAFIIDGDHISILVNLFFTFILLNLRAGKMLNIRQNSAGL